MPPVQTRRGWASPSAPAVGRRTHAAGQRYIHTVIDSIVCVIPDIHALIIDGPEIAPRYYLGQEQRGHAPSPVRPSQDRPFDLWCARSFCLWFTLITSLCRYLTSHREAPCTNEQSVHEFCLVRRALFTQRKVNSDLQSCLIELDVQALKRLHGFALGWRAALTAAWRAARIAAWRARGARGR